MNDWKEKIAFKGDKILWYIVIMLMIASVMVVYSSTGRLAYNEKAGNTFFYLIKQLFLIGGCFGVMFIVQSIHYRYFYKYAGSVVVRIYDFIGLCSLWGYEYQRSRAMDPFAFDRSYFSAFRAGENRYHDVYSPDFVRGSDRPRIVTIVFYRSFCFLWDR